MTILYKGIGKVLHCSSSWAMPHEDVLVLLSNILYHLKGLYLRENYKEKKRKKKQGCSKYGQKQ